MKKVDRLGWAAGFSFTSCGVRIGIRVNDPESLEQVKDCLPRDWKVCRSPIVDCVFSVLAARPAARSNVRRFNILYADAAMLARTTEFSDVLTALESDLGLYLAATTRRRMFFHAGVVAWGGKAILIPGSSFSGKTNLVAALVRAGATYYSDEFAVLDVRGRVHPYPLPLSFREEGRTQARRCRPETIGARVGRKPLPVSLVVLSRYRHGAEWKPRLLSPGEAMIAMLRNAMSARQQPEVVLPVLKQMLSRAPALKGFRGEADETAAFILNTLAD
jgi:hypothetical protein